jgi:hypothetical protein
MALTPCSHSFNHIALTRALISCPYSFGSFNPYTSSLNPLPQALTPYIPDFLPLALTPCHYFSPYVTLALNHYPSS